MQLSLRYQSLDLACRGGSLSDSCCYVLKKKPRNILGFDRHLLCSYWPTLSWPPRPKPPRTS